MVPCKIFSFLCGKDISLSANNNLKNPLSELKLSWFCRRVLISYWNEKNCFNIMVVGIVGYRCQS